MNAERAAALVGGPRQVIANQARALGLHAWNNTPEENERKEAAEYAIKHWKRFQAARQARHEARMARR